MTALTSCQYCKEPVCNCAGDPDRTDIPFLVTCIQTAWATRAAIEPRGFDSIRRRAELAAEVDDYLEDLFTAILLRELVE